MRINNLSCPQLVLPHAQVDAFVPPEAQGYRLIWSDDFNQPVGGSLHPMWDTSMLWGSGTIINSEEQYYTDQKNGDSLAPNPLLFDGNGSLIIRAGLNDATQQAATGQQFYSGVLSGYSKLSYQYGYLAMRMKLPPDAIGLWAALWLLNRYYAPDPRSTGANGKRETEIDIEFVRGTGGAFGGGPYDTTEVLAAYHYDDGNWKIDANGFAGKDANGNFTLPALSQQCDGSLLATNNNPAAGFDYYSLPSNADFADDFHEYGIYWDSSSVRYYCDGVMFASICDSAIVPQILKYPIINQAVGGNFPGPANPADYVGGVDMLIDWICLYQE